MKKMQPISVKSKKIDKRSVLATLGKFQSFFGLVAIFLIASIICVRNGKNLFLGADNLSNLIRAISENGIMAIGMTFVILLGGIDLSVGAMLGLSAALSASLMITNGLSFLPMILLVLGLSALFGLFNGIIHTKLGVQAFIVTLASMNMARGLARIISGGKSIPIGYQPTGPADPVHSILASRIFATEGFLGIPVPAICFVFLAILFSMLFKYTRLGRHVYAIGGNETSAFLCGIKVDRVKILMFTLCGVMAGVAGIIHSAQTRLGGPNDGMGYELNAIAAVAIGGTSMAGGKGTIAGTVVGALILGILDNMLGLNNVDVNLQLIVKGLIIIGAVVMQKERKK